MQICIEADTRPRQDGSLKVYLRVFKDVNRRRGLGFTVLPKYWDSKRGRVKISHPLQAIYNRAITDMLVKAQRIAAERPGISADALLELVSFEGKGTASLADAIAAVIDTHTQRWAEGTREALRTTLRDVRQHLPHVRLGAFDRVHAQQFHRDLLARDLQPNTVRTRLKSLRRLYRTACEDAGIEARLIFSGLIPQEQKGTPKFLMAAEVDKLRTLDAPKGLRLSRDAWLLSMFLGGMRFGDLCRLRSENIVMEAVQYTMGKTGIAKRIPLISHAKEIVDRYAGSERVLPLVSEPTFSLVRSANAQTNANLKLLAAMAGINPGLCTHWARHSFAYWAEANKIGLRELQMIFGHRTFKTTEAYMVDFDQKRVAEVFSKLDKTIG